MLSSGQKTSPQVPTSGHQEETAVGGRVRPGNDQILHQYAALVIAIAAIAVAMIAISAAVAQFENVIEIAQRHDVGIQAMICFFMPNTRREIAKYKKGNK